MKKIILGTLLVVMIFIAVLVIRVFIYPFASDKGLAEKPTEFPINENAVKRLSEAIQIPTISNVEYSKLILNPLFSLNNFCKKPIP